VLLSETVYLECAELHGRKLARRRIKKLETVSQFLP